MQVNDYLNQFKTFSNMDLNSSWVSIQEKTVNVKGKNQKVFVPIIKSKPHRFLRWIYQIFFRMKHHRNEIAKNLTLSLKDFKKIQTEQLGDNNLQKQVMNKAIKVLLKFEKHHFCTADLRKSVESGMSVNPGIPPTNPFLPPINPLLPPINPEVPPINPEVPPVNPAIEEPKIKVPEKSEASYVLAENAIKVPVSIDWKSNNVLFDPVFANDWVLEKHKKVKYSPEHQAFITFMQNLIFNHPIKDSYGKFLTEENLDCLRKMMFGILNTIKDLKDKGEADFNDKYSMVVKETCKALKNCSNAMNTAIENLFYDIYLSNLGGGGISQKVTLHLQKVRDAIFRESMKEIFAKNKDSVLWGKDYYLKHEATAMNYYYANPSLCSKLGLPPGISALDKGYEKYALKGKEAEIENLFKAKYTPQKIIDVIYDIIIDTNDSSIPTAFFTDWIEKESNLDMEDVLDEDTYQYKKGCVAHLLEKLNIIK